MKFYGDFPCHKCLFGHKELDFGEIEANNWGSNHRQEFFFTFPFLAKICGQEDLLNMELPYCATHSRSRSNYNRSRRCNAARLLQASQTIDRSAVKSRRISCSNQELTYLGKLSHCGDDNERELEPTRRARSKTVTTVTSNGNGGRLSHSMVDPPTSTTPIQLFPTPSVSPRQSFEAEVFLDDNTAYSESVHVWSYGGKTLGGSFVCYASYVYEWIFMNLETAFARLLQCFSILSYVIYKAYICLLGFF